MRSRLSTLILAAFPWSWFVVRDTAPIMEAAAVAIPAVGLGCLVAALLTWWVRPLRPVAVLFASAAVVAAVAIVAPRLPTAQAGAADPTITIGSANVNGDNPLAYEDVMALAEADVDVMVLAEANPQAIRAVEALADEYPHVEVEETPGLSRVMVVSRIPLTRRFLPADLATGRIVAVELTGDEPVTVFAAHLPRPWRNTTRTQATPVAQQRLIGRLADEVASTAGPVVVVGDLNATDRGVGYRTLLERGDLTDMMRSGWAGTTSLKWWPLLLRIDHVLARGLCSTGPATIGLPGSDHRGIVVGLGAC